MTASLCEGTSSGISLIVGLGNPGDTYHGTRHNVGAWFVEQLIAALSATRKPLKFNKDFKGLVARDHIADKECLCLIPTTYMNLSGEAVAAIAHFYKLPVSNILVVHDDLDLPLGTVRLKQGGGHAGHRGIENIVLHLQSADFVRLRIGIGHPGSKAAVTHHVLSRLKKEEKTLLEDTFISVFRAFPDILAGHLSKAMNFLHTKNDNEKE